MPDYLPYDQRIPDTQYQDMLKRVLTQGEMAEQTRQGVGAITLIQQPMHWDFRNGFPVITERDVSKFWTRGIGELCAFINGVTNVDELKEFGANWWGPWTTPEKCALFDLPPGEIGPASYGGAFHDFPTLDQPTTDWRWWRFWRRPRIIMPPRFDQYAHIVDQIKSLPYDRVHKITSWMPKENSRAVPGYQKTTIAPCHGDVQITILNDRIHLHMTQRSADTPVGVPSNIIQYAALVLMLEHLTGFEAGVYYHTMVNSHIYEDQFPNVRKLVRRKPRRLPTVELTEAGKRVTDIHDFRREHFQMSDYSAGAPMNDIPVST